jgi:hypothetical protein
MDVANFPHPQTSNLWSNSDDPALANRPPSVSISHAPRSQMALATLSFVGLTFLFTPFIYSLDGSDDAETRLFQMNENFPMFDFSFFSWPDRCMSIFWHCVDIRNKSLSRSFCFAGAWRLTPLSLYPFAVVSRGSRRRGRSSRDQKDGTRLCFRCSRRLSVFCWEKTRGHRYSQWMLIARANRKEALFWPLQNLHVGDSGAGGYGLHSLTVVSWKLSIRWHWSVREFFTGSSSY